MIHLFYTLRDVELSNRKKALIVWEKLHDDPDFCSVYKPFGDSSDSLLGMFGNFQAYYVQSTKFINFLYGAHACRLGLISITVDSENNSFRIG